MPQIAIDSSGFVMARPDSFLPLVDVIENGEYCIYMDLPGLTESDIVIIRENVVTVVQGRRKSPYIVESEGLTVVKQERKYGDFTMNFRIPDRYERRWCDYEIKDGVMKIVYKRDQDEDVASLVPRLIITSRRCESQYRRYERQQGQQVEAPLIPRILTYPLPVQSTH